VTTPADQQVPVDFPNGCNPGALSGFQPKIAVRQVDGKFVEGWSESERLARFDNCVDLVQQLTAYCQRKLQELPGATVASLLPRVRRGVELKGWDLTEQELDWIMKHVHDHLTSAPS